jgi:hypothetical protein
VAIGDWIERAGVDRASHARMLIVNSHFRQIIAGFAYCRGTGRMLGSSQLGVSEWLAISHNLTMLTFQQS